MHIRILALTLIVLATPARAEMSSNLSTGFDYSTGKYGGITATDILYVPVTGKVQFDYLYLKLTVPYISMTGTGDVVHGVGRMGRQTTTTTTAKTTTKSGLGDVIGTAGYTIYESEAVMLDLVGNVKFGTAKKNLGTGENDYSAQLDGFYTTAGGMTLFATAGYKITGEPAGTTYNDIAYGTLGVSMQTGESSSAGLMMDAAEPSSDLVPGIRELTVFVSSKISSDVKIQASLMQGFSDSSPELAGGLSVSRAF